MGGCDEAIVVTLADAEWCEADEVGVPELDDVTGAPLPGGTLAATDGEPQPERQLSIKEPSLITTYCRLLISVGVSVFYFVLSNDRKKLNISLHFFCVFLESNKLIRKSTAHE